MIDQQNRDPENRDAWCGGPGNKRDRARFARLSGEQKDAASALAASRYDGSRTVARCWVEALDEVEAG